MYAIIAMGEEFQNAGVSKIKEGVASKNVRLPYYPIENYSTTEIP
jgi:hypothetical protein